ncbi:MAG: metal-dependent transcriptional regulator [Candidatus Omnitrophica bacterium]|nr:metal-dependent transcriptional regulator [Candidatus Omnitrophota bacterium]
MLTQTLEDYLEAIAILEKEKGKARIKDIGNYLKVKNPSVVSAINSLTENGYVQHKKYSYVTLTKKGRDVAEEIHKKHKTITKFLKDFLKIDEATAKEDACKIEHIISHKTYKKIASAVEENI